MQNDEKVTTENFRKYRFLILSYGTRGCCETGSSSSRRENESEREGENEREREREMRGMKRRKTRMTSFTEAQLRTL